MYHSEFIALCTTYAVFFMGFRLLNVGCINYGCWKQTWPRLNILYKISSCFKTM